MRDQGDKAFARLKHVQHAFTPSSTLSSYFSPLTGIFLCMSVECWSTLATTLMFAACKGRHNNSKSLPSLGCSASASPLSTVRLAPEAFYGPAAVQVARDAMRIPP